MKEFNKAVMKFKISEYEELNMAIMIFKNWRNEDLILQQYCSNICNYEGINNITIIKTIFF